MDSPTTTTTRNKRKMETDESSDEDSRKKGGGSSVDETWDSISGGKGEENDADSYSTTGLDERFVAKVVSHFRNLMSTANMLMPTVSRSGSSAAATPCHPLYPESVVVAATPPSLSYLEHQDFTIRCQKEMIDFKVHKCVLAKKSDFFRAMFDSGMTESESSVVQLSQEENQGGSGDGGSITAAEMELFLYFLYIPETFGVHLGRAVGLDRVPIEGDTETVTVQIMWIANSLLGLGRRYMAEGIRTDVEKMMLRPEGFERMVTREPSLLALLISRHEISVDGKSRASVSSSILRKIDVDTRDGSSDAADRDIGYITESDSHDREILRFALMFGYVTREIKEILSLTTGIPEYGAPFGRTAEKKIVDLKDALRNLCGFLTKGVVGSSENTNERLSFLLDAYAT